MTDYGDTNAWIKLSYGSDALYINAENWEYGKSDPSAINLDYPNRGHFGKSFNAEKVIVKIKNAYVTTEAAWNILKEELEAAEDAGDATLRIQISSDPTYELFNGATGKDIMPVIIADKKGYTKKFKGDTTYYLIKMITFRQSGALT